MTRFLPSSAVLSLITGGCGQQLICFIENKEICGGVMIYGPGLMGLSLRRTGGGQVAGRVGGCPPHHPRVTGRGHGGHIYFRLIAPYSN